MRASTTERRHSGEPPIVGVNTFLTRDGERNESLPSELIRSSEAEKKAQIAAVRAFRERHSGEVDAALARLQQVATSGGNIFSELMETVKVASLGQISAALYAAGGEYRRNM